MDWKPITELRSVTCHMGSHSVTCHPTQVKALTQAMQAGTVLPIPEGWKAELTLVVGYILRWFTSPQTVTHPSSNRLIATWPGAECTTSRSQAQCQNRYTTKPPTSRQQYKCVKTIAFNEEHEQAEDKTNTRTTTWTVQTQDSVGRTSYYLQNFKPASVKPMTFYL